MKIQGALNEPCTPRTNVMSSTYLKLGPKRHTVTVNEVLFRPNQTTVIHACNIKESEADTSNHFLFFKLSLE